MLSACNAGGKLSAVKTSAAIKPAKSGAAAEKTSRNATLQARVRHTDRCLNHPYLQGIGSWQPVMHVH